MARIDQTDEWQNRHAPTISTFESLAMEAYGHLPEEFRALTGNLIIEIADFPSDDVFDDMALETPFDLLGLFEGRGISERFTVETGEMPNRITLYRRAILDYWAENEETLGDIIPCFDPRDRPSFRPVRRRHGADRGQRRPRSGRQQHLTRLKTASPRDRGGA